MATLPSLRLNDVRISAELLSAHDRMLTGGFYAELELTYDATVAEEKGGRPFGIESLRPIQLSKRGDAGTISLLGGLAFSTESMETPDAEKCWL